MPVATDSTTSGTTIICSGRSRKSSPAVFHHAPISAPLACIHCPTAAPRISAANRSSIWVRPCRIGFALEVMLRS